MRLYDTKLIDLAIGILRDEARYFGEPRGTLPTRLALHVLRPYVDRHPLEQFWRLCTNPNPSQRVHQQKKVLALMEGAVARKVAGE